MTDIDVHVLAEHDHRAIAYWCSTCQRTHGDCIAGVAAIVTDLEPGDILGERQHHLCPADLSEEAIVLRYAGIAATLDDVRPATTTLYRLYDDAGALLYIGIAGNPGRRFEQHHATKPWWSQVTTIRLQHHPDRTTALAAEVDAIRTERPRHNVIHNHRSVR